MTLDDLNRLPAGEAEQQLARCCGSSRWAAMMAAARPFATLEELASTAERLWIAVGPADWLEAFAAHPRIGERATSAWSAEEQSGARSAPADVAGRLARGNRQYEALFGYTFLVCATGKSAEDMLAMLEDRMKNPPDREIGIAAEEQRKITALRLRKLVAS